MTLSGLRPGTSLEPGLFEAPLSAAEMRVSRALLERLEPGCRVVVADGVGSPLGLLRPLAEAARVVGGVELVLGWYLGQRTRFPSAAFPVVRSYLAGYGLADNSDVRYAPARLSALPALLAGPWRPHLLLLAVTEGPEGLCFGTEMSWVPAGLRTATHIVAELNRSLPASGATIGGADRIAIVSEVRRPPVALPTPRRTEDADRIGRIVASLVPSGACLQFGPGIVGDAALRAIEEPVRITSGIVGDPAMDLERRGLLLDDPLGAYLAGSSSLYAWAHGRRLVDAVEITHDATRLSQLPLIAINTALEIDLTGQANVEGVAGRTIAGIGGLADFALAAARAPDGLSIVALPTVRGGRRTLVEQLGAPVSCVRSDIDIVVTEKGKRDLRGLSDAERTKALNSLW